MANAKKWISLSILLVLAAAGAVWGYLRWSHSRVHVTTENAYVRGDIFPVSSRIPGTLLEVNFRDDQEVKQGEALAVLDPRDYDMAIEKARASLHEAEAALFTDAALVAQGEAQLRAARSQLDLARTELARVGALFERQSIPKQRLDQVVAQEEVASAQVEAAAKTIAAAKAKLGVSRRKVDVAQASLDGANLQRSYCTVVSPASGVISRKSAEVGQVVAPGQPICAVVPLGIREIWVEANFKETQLTKMRTGQKARLRADVDPSRTFTGTVESLGAGTGAAFSLLPPENATGNWVKVVQRVPVRIRLDPGTDPEHKLRIGLSVAVEVDTTSKL